jgi:hypothetical protein
MGKKMVYSPGAQMNHHPQKGKLSSMNPVVNEEKGLAPMEKGFQRDIYTKKVK